MHGGGCLHVYCSEKLRCLLPHTFVGRVDRKWTQSIKPQILLIVTYFFQNLLRNTPDSGDQIIKRMSLWEVFHVQTITGLHGTTQIWIYAQGILWFQLTVEGWKGKKKDGYCEYHSFPCSLLTYFFSSLFKSLYQIGLFVREILPTFLSIYIGRKCVSICVGIIKVHLYSETTGLVLPLSILLPQTESHPEMVIKLETDMFYVSFCL